GDLIDVIAGVVELQVGDRPGGTADRFPVHAADEAEKRPGGRESTQDIGPLVVQGRAADLDQAGVVRPAVEAQLAQPGRIERFRRLGRAGAFAVALVEAPHGRVFGEVHDRPFFVYASIGRKKHWAITPRRWPAAASSPPGRAGRSPRPPRVRWPGAAPPPRPAPPSRSGASLGALAGRAGRGRLRPARLPASRGPATA